MPGQSARAHLGNGLLVAVQILLMVLVVMGPSSTGTAEVWPAPWGLVARISGIALLACGGLLALGGALRMGDNLTPSSHPREGAPLLVGGAYGLVRHPMYGGLILAAFGWALFVNGPLTLLYACVLFVWVPAPAHASEGRASANRTAATFVRDKIGRAHV